VSGAATAVAAALTGGAVAVLLAPRRTQRLARALPAARRPAAGPAPSGRLSASRLSSAGLASAVAGVALALLLPAPSGLLAGLVVAVGGPHVLARLEPRRVREEHQQLLRDLPLLLDLLAACLKGGAPLPAAAAAVSAAVPGPAGRRLAAVCAALDVGTPPGEAWQALAGRAGLDDCLAPVARALARSADGGAPVAATVTRLATDARAEARARGEQAARRAGVMAVAPLGLCFLPAFVLLGVVPVVIGLVGPLLTSL
jgi:pilus assembly protein TadC